MFGAAGRTLTPPLPPSPSSQGLLHGVHEVAVKVFTDQGGADAAASGKRHADLRREIALLLG